MMIEEALNNITECRIATNQSLPVHLVVRKQLVVLFSGILTVFKHFSDFHIEDEECSSVEWMN